jgi:hypothetical protein
MDLIAKRLTHFTMIAATLAACLTVAPSKAAESALRVVQLQPVVVTAKRIRVVQLERVVVTAQRVTPVPTVVAQRASRGAVTSAASRV